MCKKNVFSLIIFFSFVALYGQTKADYSKKIMGQRLIVVSPISEGLGKEAVSLNGMIHDLLQSNMQEYAEMKLVSDDDARKAVQKIQKESESFSFDESQQIELGKISSAKFGLFTTIRKVNANYSISVDFRDLTTAEILATAVSQSYKNIDDLYVPTGAVDEVTLSLCEKLGIKLTSIQKAKLMNLGSSLNISEQLQESKLNEAKYISLISELEKQIALLSVSSDATANSEKNKLEAQKALYKEKEEHEKKRKAELELQLKMQEEDRLNEKLRSVEFIEKRDELARIAEKKAQEARKMAMEKQGVLGQISIIEAKKKALIGIRNDVNQRIKEIETETQTEITKKTKEINSRKYREVELSSDGTPLAEAVKRRKNLIRDTEKELNQKCLNDSMDVVLSTYFMEQDIIADIKQDEKNLQKQKKVSSLGNELKVSYGAYNTNTESWSANISLYSDGILLNTVTVDLKYEKVTGKKVPNLVYGTDAELDEYEDNYKIYNSLFNRGIPMFYYEMSYSVEASNVPSEYIIKMNDVVVFRTDTQKFIDVIHLSKEVKRQFYPVYSLEDSYPKTIINSDVYKNKLEDLIESSKTEEQRIQEAIEREKKQKQEEERRQEEEKRRQEEKKKSEAEKWKKEHIFPKGDGTVTRNVIFSSFGISTNLMRELLNFELDYELGADLAIFGGEYWSLFAGLGFRGYFNTAELDALYKPNGGISFFPEIGLTVGLPNPVFENAPSFSVYGKYAIGKVNEGSICGQGLHSRFTIGLDYRYFEFEYSVEHTNKNYFADRFALGIVWDFDSIRIGGSK